MFDQHLAKKVKRLEPTDKRGKHCDVNIVKTGDVVMNSSEIAMKLSLTHSAYLIYININNNSNYPIISFSFFLSAKAKRLSLRRLQ